MTINFQQEALALFEYTRTLRRDFHQHPELGLHEIRTSEIVAKELTNIGLEVTTGVAQTGVIGLLRGKTPGSVLLLRFDMDALPIQEETGAVYTSLNPGVMHACGHDAHISVGLTVAKLLKQHQNEIKGTVKFMFQPAEEGGGGAEKMIAAGVLENPKPDTALSFHVWNEAPVGDIVLTAGPVMAGGEKFAVRITGKGGHGGANVQKTLDPVMAAAQVITALQSIVSRNVAPLEAAVVSVTTVHAGETFNVIPQFADFTGTIRTFDPEVRQRVLTRFEQIVKGISEAMGCRADIHIERLTPAVINNARVTAQVAQVIRNMLPDTRVIEDFKTMGSEDMAYVMEQVPGCFILIGSGNPEKGFNSIHHHPKFDIDEAVLPRAAAVMTATALDFLK